MVKNKYEYGQIEFRAIEIKNWKAADGGAESYIDIRPIIFQFSLYESLFSPALQAELVINDSGALPELFPIIGDELVRVSFRTPGEEKFIDKIFIINSMTDRQRMKDRQQAYSLHLVTLETIINFGANIKNAYGFDNPIPIHEMVEDIYKNYLQVGNGDAKWINGSRIDWRGIKIAPKKIDIEKTQGDHYFCMTHMYPVEAIQFLAREAQSQQYKDTSHFLFYEDHKGHHFKTLEKIKNDNSDHSAEYFFGDPSYYSAIRNKKKEPSDYKRIIEFEISDGFDIIQRLKGGFYDQETIWFDPLAHKFANKSEETDLTYNYFKGERGSLGFAEFRHITRSQTVKQRLNSNKSYVEKSDEGNIPGRLKKDFLGDSYTNLLVTNHKAAEKFNDDKQLKPRKRSEIVHNKKASRESINTLKLTITIPGDSTRIPGEMLYIHIPSMSGEEDQLNKEDKILSGYWLSTSVRHMYNDAGGYITIINLVKDAYEEVLASSKNIFIGV